MLFRSLSTHYGHIDCKNKEVRLFPPNQPVVTYSCQGKREDHPIISSIEAKKFLKDGGKGYLAMIHEEPNDELRLEEVPIIQEFVDVFPEELSKLPPKRGGIYHRLDTRS